MYGAIYAATVGPCEYISTPADQVYNVRISG